MLGTRTFINKLFQNEGDFQGKTITVCGMIQNIRKQSNMVFVELNDGTQLKGLQVILDNNFVTDEKFDDIFEHGTKGTIISCTGRIMKSPAKGQSFEMIAN